MMSPEPHFNAVANSDAELKDFKNMENLTEAAIVRLLFCLKCSAFRRSFLPQKYRPRGLGPEGWCTYCSSPRACGSICAQMASLEKQSNNSECHLARRTGVGACFSSTRVVASFSSFALTRRCATPRDCTMAGERRGENESQHYVGGGHGGARPERYSVGPKRGGRGGDNGGGRYLGYSCDNSLGFRV